MLSSSWFPSLCNAHKGVTTGILPADNIVELCEIAVTVAASQRYEWPFAVTIPDDAHLSRRDGRGRLPELDVLGLGLGHLQYTLVSITQ